MVAQRPAILYISRMHNTYSPLAQEIPFCDAITFSAALDHYNNSVFFHSARVDDTLGHYSFIALDPFEIIKHSDDETCDVFAELHRKLEFYALATISELPPFQGGLAGYLSYDLVRDLEVLPTQAVADIGYPKLILGFYDLVVSMDHIEQKAWIISSGLPELDDAKRQVRAQTRLQWLLAEIKNTPVHDYDIGAVIDADDIVSNFSEVDYKAAVTKVINYIKEGDVFEVNIAQRFKCALPKGLTPFQLYRRICAKNPAPFASYMRFDELAIASSSPERFLKVSDNLVETRPIKGTIKRSDNKETDQLLGQQLMMSEKNCAENAMIVDLMRNDLSRVCLPHSVQVPQFCQLESYQNVHHLVSVVTGTLRPDCNRVDLLKATLAGGSITGAPKIRAMEIIDELEPTRRGPYCGNAMYLGFNGAMDSSILIRSYVISNDTITFQGGGAVVLDSDPAQEYEETFVKVRMLMAALMENVTEEV